jgi:hypothetical protein
MAKQRSFGVKKGIYQISMDKIPKFKLIEPKPIKFRLPKIKKYWK